MNVLVLEADTMSVGSGIKARDVVATPELMSRLRLYPARQLLGAQCSGTPPTMKTYTSCGRLGEQSVGRQVNARVRALMQQGKSHDRLLLAE